MITKTIGADSVLGRILRARRCRERARNTQAMEESLEVWFTREVLSHEAAFSHFIARLWPKFEEHADFRQEAYARVFRAARRARPAAPRAFLFATARHLIADRARREQVVCIRTSPDSDFTDRLIDEISPEQKVAAALELAELAVAFERLSNRSQEVLWLRRIQGLSQKEVASLLGISEKTVEKHLRIGTRHLAQLMHGRAYRGPSRDGLTTKPSAAARAL